MTIKFIAYGEILPDGREIVKGLTIEQAIEIQKQAAAKTKAFVYPDDKTALEDFVDINWAWFVELE